MVATKQRLIFWPLFGAAVVTCLARTSPFEWLETALVALVFALAILGIRRGCDQSKRAATPILLSGIALLFALLTFGIW